MKKCLAWTLALCFGVICGDRGAEIMLWKARLCRQADNKEHKLALKSLFSERQNNHQGKLQVAGNVS